VDDKPSEMDAADLEREMLALAAAVAAESRGSGPDEDASLPAQTGSVGHDARLVKKERGRLRQKRRLGRRAKRQPG
jgi:hypothetical protein